MRKQKDGLSALFDALLFFMIILAATGALFYWASVTTAKTTEDLASLEPGRCASEVLTAALECTVGPVNLTACGQERAFSGSVYGAVAAVLEAREADADCGISGLVDAVRGVFGLLVEKPFHFGLRASLEGFGPDLCIAEEPGGPMNPGAVRWTCAVPLIVDGSAGELTLYLWR